SRKQDNKTKKEAKGKSPIESFTRYRDLNAKFEDCFENSSNEVNAAGTIVPTVRQNTSNNTKPFSAAELEDITYSDDENDVGAEADFNNLETSITIEAMHEELRQFKMQKVWVLVDLPHEKRAIVARIETLRLFLAYASFMVYQMDVKSAFLYRTIEEELYVCQPSKFEDPDHPDKVYKVVKALYGLH
nr:hypothetical protein [Tanacetum cinerariifolium]